METVESLKDIIKIQKEHIKILEGHVEFLQNEHFGPRSKKPVRNVKFGEKGYIRNTLKNSSLSKDSWFDILHGAWMGTFIYLYLRYYDVIRDFHLN